MSQGLKTILLLVGSNTFMTLAWYGHLCFKDIKFFQEVGIFGAILISWGIAFLEYCLMVPANKIGYRMNGGPFDMWQLKIIQEVVSISVFVVFTLLVFKTEQFKWNHFAGFLCMMLAVFFMFKK